MNIEIVGAESKWNAKEPIPERGSNHWGGVILLSLSLMMWKDDFVVIADANDPGVLNGRKLSSAESRLQGQHYSPAAAPADDEGTSSLTDSLLKVVVYRNSEL